MNTRIKLLRKRLKKTQPEFGKLCGKSRDAIATYESGRVIPDDTFIKMVCMTFNVNENWLRTGKGEMFIQTEDTIFEAFAKKYKLSEAEREVTKYCLQLTSEERKAVLNHILNIADVIRSTEHTKPAHPHKPDTELTREEAHQIIDQEFDDKEKGIISTASTGTNGSEKNR